MDKRDAIIEKLREQGLMPLYFHADETISVELMKALYMAGVRLIEYTNRGKQALSNFSAMKKIAAKDFPDLFLGAGTVKDETAASQFIDAGADFLISPALAEDVFAVAYSNKILWIPGCMTPTEILKAEQFGISLVKIFPGNVLGPAYVKAIRDIFPSIQFVPTGGADNTPGNLEAWFEAGVCAVGMGSKLLSKELMENRNYSAIQVAAQTMLQQVQSIIHPQ